MIRWLSLAVGVCLVAVAFAAATYVANTREGLIAEVVLEFASLIGISLTLYGLLAGTRRPGGRARPEGAAPVASPIRTVRDLIAGIGGLLLALVLLTGLALTSGFAWAAMGGVLLLPMVAGSVYLCARFAAASERSWKLELRKPDRQNQA